MTFYVEGLSNHLEQQTHVRRIGEFQSMDEAIRVAQSNIDDFLNKEYKPGMDGQKLFSIYRAHGEYPFIFRDDDKTFNVPGFNHAHYAFNKASVICGDK